MCAVTLLRSCCAVLILCCTGGDYSVCCDAIRFSCGGYCGWSHRGCGASGCGCVCDSAGGVSEVSKKKKCCMPM